MAQLSKEKRDQLILAILLTAIAVILLWFGGVTMLRGNLDNAVRKRDREALNVAKARRQVQMRGRVEKELSDARKELEQAENKMVSGDLYTWLVTTLPHFSAPYHVDIPQLSEPDRGPATLLPDFPFHAATYKVRGTAYYQDFGKFIASFENAFPYARFQNLTLEPISSPDPTQREKLSFNVEIVALIKPRHSP